MRSSEKPLTLFGIMPYRRFTLASAQAKAVAKVSRSSRLRKEPTSVARRRSLICMETMPMLLVAGNVEPRPEGIETMLGHAASRGELAHGNVGARDTHLFTGASRPVVQPERPEEQQEIQPEEENDRPGAYDHEDKDVNETHEAGDQKQDLEALQPQRTVRGQRGGENRLLLGRYLGVAIVHDQ